MLPLSYPLPLPLPLLRGANATCIPRGMVVAEGFVTKPPRVRVRSKPKPKVIEIGTKANGLIVFPAAEVLLPTYADADAVR
mmetsp:Transcript_25833/g.65545  ORF Transcript_25833/g.65545 Transcript_25833/m.65545 type:complete len:81 (+) Transcript_25833:988-1230(+)